ncbi:MAG: hypothetical protein JXR68_03455 [Bacteroidales bacterium]|nr:hypothetical protein [Bacteroidales bacterium]
MQNEIKYKLNFSDYHVIVDFIKKTYNYDFSVYSFCISKRRIELFFSQYNVDNLQMILSFLSKEKFWVSFLEQFIVKTTELFRDVEFWQKLHNKYISKLDKGTTLNIWVPDITSDEELVTLIILLYELQITDYKIIATSPFNFVIEKIENYKISTKKFDISKQNYKNFNPEGDLEKFFLMGKLNHSFKPEYFKNVRFKKFSLISEQDMIGVFDFILFRNRLLYYSSKAQDFVLNKLYNSLKIKGLYAIGVKESLRNWQNIDKLTTADKELNIYFKKK